MQPEARFIARIHKHLDNRVHCEKMHNVYRRGMADCWYSGEWGDLWVEYKWLPKKRVHGIFSPKDVLAPLQLRWLCGRAKENRDVRVVVGFPGGAWIFYPADFQRDYLIQELTTHAEGEVVDMILWKCLRSSKRVYA